MKNKTLNNIIFFVILIVNVFFTILLSYSKVVAPDTGDVDRDFLKKHTIEEWVKLQDENLYIDEIPLLVEFFSPTYLSYYNPAFDSAVASYRANGVDNDVVNSLKDTSKLLEETIKELKKEDPKSELIPQLESQKASVDKNSSMMNRKFSSINFQVGNNNQLQYAKNLMIKSMQGAFTSYKLLEKYENLLEKQTSLYKDIYVLTEKNVLLGVATDNDVKAAYATYLATKNNFDNMKAQRANVKRQICLSLGFNIEEVDDIDFIEPDVDFDYLLSIDRQRDNEMAINSNTAYRGSSLTDFNSKAGSTFEQREDFRKILKDKILIEMDELYTAVEVSHKNYDASLVGSKILDIDSKSRIRKKNNGLLSKNQDLGLQISLLNDEINIYSAKYNFIQALLNYKYATLGVTNTN